MEIATIGFTKSSAEHFFERLKKAKVKRVLDVRLKASSQLAGFAKSEDLAWFAGQILGATYERDERLAPDEELMNAYRKEKLPLPEFERRFLKLMNERDIPNVLDRKAFDRKTVLVCSEAEPEGCHRRFVAELLAKEWGAKVEHL